jgi:hypothetical protein
MPRRLDPKKGLPGLFAPGRPKAADIEFLVQAKDAATAQVTPPRPRARPKKPVAVEVAPAPIALAPSPPPTPLPTPPPPRIPDYLLLAPPFRAVPTLRREPDPIRLVEIPSFVHCGVSWIVSLCRG